MSSVYWALRALSSVVRRAFVRWAVVRSDFSWRRTGLVGSRPRGVGIEVGVPGARGRLVCEEEWEGVVVSLGI